MNDALASDRGLTLWQEFSTNETLGSLPPLTRLIQAVRERSRSADELLELAFTLCEANLAICRHEYNRWQGWAIVDATSVFSLEGLGGDLIRGHGYDFWGFLRAMADLAKASSDPAQYHQCINHNLFTSSADDRLILDRWQSLQASGDPHNLGCMVPAGNLLDRLNAKPADHPADATDCSHQAMSFRTHPSAFSVFGRNLKWRMDGPVMVKSPFCFNIWLERPLLWLAGVNLAGLNGNLLGAELELSYELELDETDSANLRLLLASTAAEPQEPGRAERHFWLYEPTLPLDGQAGVTVSLHPKAWQALLGHPRAAYGQKCTAADLAETLNTLPLQLLLALEPSTSHPIPSGSLALPSLILTAPQVAGIPNP